jgi:uncharacterized protein (TIGR02996 family)
MPDAIDPILQALHVDPGDETAWLALADCLEETGDPDRAELTRLTVQLRNREGHPGDEQAERRMQELLARGVLPCVPIRGNGLGMQFTLIPPGRFRMGSPLAEDDHHISEGPQHEVRITRPFYLGIFPVTQAQYEEVMGDNPSRFSSTGGNRSTVRKRSTREFPVENVSWEQARAFCAKLPDGEYRLPTEAEWEYACRAGTTTPFHFGSSASSTQANFDGNHPYGGAKPGPYLSRTCPVGSYVPNAFGLFDMHGNVLEWTSDWFASKYPSAKPRKDPGGPKTGDTKVVRGGSWWIYARKCRSACREGFEPSFARNGVVGFRVAQAVT